RRDAVNLQLFWGPLGFPLARAEGGTGQVLSQLRRFRQVGPRHLQQGGLARLVPAVANQEPLLVHLAGRECRAGVLGPVLWGEEAEALLSVLVDGLGPQGPGLGAP